MNYYNTMVQSDALLRRADAQAGKASGLRAKAEVLEEDAAAMRSRAEELRVEALLSQDLPLWETAKRALKDPNMKLDKLNQIYCDLWKFLRTELYERSARYEVLGDKALVTRLEDRKKAIVDWVCSDFHPRLEELKRQEKEEAEFQRAKAGDFGAYLATKLSA